MSTRQDTLMFCFNAVNVVSAIHKLSPEFKTRFPAELIQRICGTLDTNSYDLSWSRVKARALYQVCAILDRTYDNLRNQTIL